MQNGSYLQLQLLMVSVLSPFALSVLDFPELLEGMTGLVQKPKPVTDFYKCLMDLFKIDIQEF